MVERKYRNNHHRRHVRHQEANMGTSNRNNMGNRNNMDNRSNMGDRNSSNMERHSNNSMEIRDKAREHHEDRCAIFQS